MGVGSICQGVAVGALAESVRMEGAAVGKGVRGISTPMLDGAVGAELGASTTYASRITLVRARPASIPIARLCLLVTGPAYQTVY